MKSVVFIFSLIFHTGHFLHSQNHHWQITLKGGREISTQSLSLEGDSIVTDNQKKTSVSSISDIKMFNNSPFKNGAGSGFIIGAVLGSVVAFISYEKPKGDSYLYNPDGPDKKIPASHGQRGTEAALGGFLGGIIGLLVGGLFGVLSDGENYKLADMTYEKELVTIQELVDKEQNSTQYSFATEWKVVEINFSDVIKETDAEFSMKFNNSMILLKKSDVKIVRRTPTSIILALPTKLYDEIFKK